jgi:hypothetical protein
MSTTASFHGYSIQMSLPVCSRCIKDGTPADQQKFLSNSGYMICLRDGSRVPVPGKYHLPKEVGALFRTLLERHGFQTQRFEPNIADNLVDDGNRQLSRLVLVNRQRNDVLLTLEWYIANVSSFQPCTLAKLEGNKNSDLDQLRNSCSSPLLEGIFDELTDPRKDRLIWRQGYHSNTASNLRLRQNFAPSEECGHQYGWLVLGAELFWDASTKEDGPYSDE